LAPPARNGSVDAGEVARAMHDAATLLRDHLEQVFDRFENQVSRNHPVQEVLLDLGGHPIRIRTAGHANLPASSFPALAHLPQPSPSNPRLTLDLVAWDEAATGIPFPSAPWSLPALTPGTRLASPPGSHGFRLAGATRAEGIHLFDPDSRRAAWLLPDASHMPTFHYGLPFLTVFKWWAPTVGLRLLHAGCVGLADRSALLVGTGGSGKSTTSLLCALDGLDFLSDDICLVRPGSTPTAINLYNSGKLHRDHLQRFPVLSSRSIDPEPDVIGKPVILIHRHFPQRVALSRPVRAILAPRVTGKPPTTVEPIPPGEALRALAPSTFVQLSPDDPSTFRDLASLIRQIPCFRLHLGTRTEEIPPIIRELLTSLE
jgi:hypothetical protein